MFQGFVEMARLHRRNSLIDFLLCFGRKDNCRSDRRFCHWQTLEYHCRFVTALGYGDIDFRRAGFKSRELDRHGIRSTPDLIEIDQSIRARHLMLARCVGYTSEHYVGALRQRTTICEDDVHRNGCASSTTELAD